MASPLRSPARLLMAPAAVALLIGLFGLVAGCKSGPPQARDELAGMSQFVANGSFEEMDGTEPEGLGPAQLAARRGRGVRRRVDGARGRPQRDHLGREGRRRVVGRHRPDPPLFALPAERLDQDGEPRPRPRAAAPRSTSTAKSRGERLRSPGRSDWTRVETEFDAGANDAIEVTCLFGGWGRATGKAWFDDVELVRLSGRDVSRPKVTIDAAKTGTPMSKYIYGQFIEHLGRCIYQGIWAEMLEDRKFFWTSAKANRRGRRSGRPDSVKMDTVRAVHRGAHASRDAQRQGARRDRPRRLSPCRREGICRPRRPARRTRAPRPSRSALIWGDGPDARQTFAVKAIGRDYKTYPFTFKAGRVDRERPSRDRVGGTGLVQDRHGLDHAGRQRRRLSARSPGPAEGARRARLPLARRQLRQRLRLARRDRRPRPAAAAQEPGLDGRRAQRRRHPRVPRPDADPRGRALYHGQQRPRRRHHGPRGAPVRQRRGRDDDGQAAGRERPSRAVGRQALVRRQRNVRRLAARPHAALRLRQEAHPVRGGHEGHGPLDQDRGRGGRRPLERDHAGRGLEPHGFHQRALLRRAQARPACPTSARCRRRFGGSPRRTGNTRPRSRRSRRGRSRSRSTSGTTGTAQTSTARSGRSISWRTRWASRRRSTSTPARATSTSWPTTPKRSTSSGPSRHRRRRRCWTRRASSWPSTGAQFGTIPVAVGGTPEPLDVMACWKDESQDRPDALDRQPDENGRDDAPLEAGKLKLPRNGQALSRGRARPAGLQRARAAAESRGQRRRPTRPSARRSPSRRSA